MIKMMHLEISERQAVEICENEIRKCKEQMADRPPWSDEYKNAESQLADYERQKEVILSGKR